MEKEPKTKEITPLPLPKIVKDRCQINYFITICFSVGETALGLTAKIPSDNSSLVCACSGADPVGGGSESKPLKEP